MNQETFWKEFSTLPPPAQDLVADFVIFSQAKYHMEPAKAQANQDTKITDEPFIGMWKDRTDILESSKDK